MVVKFVADLLSRDRLLRSSFHMQIRPGKSQVRGHSRCPRVTAGDRSSPLVLARMWHGAWPGPASYVGQSD